MGGYPSGLRRGDHPPFFLIPENELSVGVPWEAMPSYVQAEGGGYPSLARRYLLPSSILFSGGDLPPRGVEGVSFYPSCIFFKKILNVILLKKQEKSIRLQ